MYKLKNNKAFTIIELLVVIAIVGILVLLAMPRFSGYIEKARIAKIENDIKVVEITVDEYLIDNNIDNWEIGQPGNGDIYDKQGRIDSVPDEVKIVPDELIVSKLEGTFYSNQGGKVYYEDIKSSNNTNIEKPDEPMFPEDNISIATDEDFTWVVDNRGYTAANQIDKGYYKYTGSAKKVKIPHTINGNPMTNYYKMFYETDVTKVVNDNTNVTNMSFMFEDSQATSLDLSSFDTSSVTSMYSMFENSRATSLDLSSFDTSEVTDMSFMFEDSQAITLDLSSFDTSSVTNMRWMFENSRATTLDLSSFDTSSVTDMSSMFEDSQATSLDLSSFDTSEVTNMSNMFYGSQATTLDLSSFDTSEVTDMSFMFRDSQATTLDLSSFDTSKVTNMSNMFYGFQSTTLDLSNFDTSNVTNMDYMFCNSQASTVYARTEADARNLNNSSYKPSGLKFEVKQH